VCEFENGDAVMMSSHQKSVAGAKARLKLQVLPMTKFSILRQRAVTQKQVHARHHKPQTTITQHQDEEPPFLLLLLLLLQEQEQPRQCCSHE
jgi:hypothetical protein